MYQPVDLKPKKSGFFKVFLVVIIIGVLILTVVVVRGFFLDAKSARPQNPPMQSEISPTLYCGEPVLTFGTTNLRIQQVAAAADGSFAIPTDTDDVAYWLSGTATDSVFALSATPNNLALGKSLIAGELVSITWPSCEVTTFTLAAPELGASFSAASSDQVAGGFILFIQNAPPGEGFVVKGSPVEAQMISTDTPAPGGPGIESEIELLEISTSQDKSTILVSVSIWNYGASEFTVTANDVWLIPQSAAPLAPAKVKPSLPRKIKPGETKTFDFTFPRPSSATAALKIFSVEFDLEGF